MRRILLHPLLPLLGALLALPAVPACNKSSDASATKEKAGPKAPTAFPVDVAPVQARKVEYVINAVGSVDAFEQVQITARVAGAIEEVRFSEGANVKKGQVLVEIEPRRFQLAVQSARASLQRAQASKDDAVRTLERREKMLAEGIASAEELDAMRTKLATSSAELASAQAAVSLAELNLRDAYVRAPVDGTIQTRNIRTGQYAQAGTVLATLVQREPLLLRVQIPEQESTSLRVGMRAQFTVRGIEGVSEAELTLVGEAADPATRMVPVVGTIRSPKPELRPGAFAEVSIPVGASVEAPVIPESAVRPSERGFLAFVIEDGKAHERVLKLGMHTSDGYVEVKSGVRAGEMLVVRGAEALKEGSTVKVSAAPPPPAPTSTPTPPPERDAKAASDAGTPP